MKPRQDQLDTADLLLRMDVDRHAPAVIDHLERLVLEQSHADRLAVARNRFINAVVDDLVCEVIGSRGVGIHAWTAAHRVQTTQNFDIGSGIRFSHSYSSSETTYQALRILAAHAAFTRD
jgi:hypothetical protein